MERGEGVEWEVVRDVGDFLGDFQLVVAMTFGGTGPEGHEENSGDNARLIAAAPTLLTALRDLLNRVDAEGSAYCAEEAEAAHTAIFQATGSAS